MNSKTIHSRLRANAYYNKMNEGRKMLYRIKELSIEKKVTLQLQHNKYMKLRYCEVVTSFNGTKTHQSVMLEFENTTHAPFTLKYIYSFGMQSLYDQIGVRCVCENIIRTEGDRVQLYVTCMASPATARRQATAIKDSQIGTDTSSGIDTASTNRDLADDNICTDSSSDVSKTIDVNRTTDSSSDKEQGTSVKVRALPTGSIESRTFDGRPVQDFVIIRSTSSQTEESSPSYTERTITAITKDVPKLEQPRIGLASVGHHINKTMQMSRLREQENFKMARKYLAYYRYNTDFGFKGETKMSLEHQLRSNGITVEMLDEMYSEVMSEHYSPEEIDQDLKQVRSMLWTERLLHLSRARDAARSYMPPSKQRITPGNQHYDSVSSGRCDPECCVLM